MSAAGELLLPRTKGFVTLAQGLRKKFYGVLDMTIVYTGRGGGLLPFQSLGTNALWEVFGGDAPVGAGLFDDAFDCARAVFGTAFEKLRCNQPAVVCSGAERF